MKKLDFVNTKIGSFNEARFSNGNVYPITATPFGMAHFSLQTDGAKTRFFNPTEHTFEGIRLTHQPSPWLGDYGHLLFLPFSGKLHEEASCRWSSYRPQEATIEPYELGLKEQRYRVYVKLAPTCRGAIMQVKNISDQETGLAFVSYDEATVFCVGTNTVTGYTDARQSVHTRFKNLREYFYAEFSAPIKRKVDLERGGVAFYFDGDVEMKISTSFVSEKQAKRNFEYELANETYNTVRNAAMNQWEDYLSLIEVEGQEKRKRTFYSCMYRAFLYPRVFHELDENGEPIHFNVDTDKVEKGVFYTDNGFWDTYRTVYPLLSIIKPELVAEMIEGFVNYAEETGWLPKWISPGEVGMMPGTLVEAVLADAAVSGIIKGELLNRAYKAMLKNAYNESESPKHGRKALTDYIELGYVPSDVKECVNHTCDCAYGDYCIAQVARIVGDMEQYEKLLARSKNYENIFDKDTRFLRAKDRNGNFIEPFDPYAWGGANCEGSSWQNSFGVYHDVDGLARLHGGKEKLAERLDELFHAEPVFTVGGYGSEIHEMSEMACVDFGQMAISNQPSFHIPWLYTMIGQREKTEKQVENLVDKAFNYKDDGFPGDEDNGTTSCWYIFACLGFYPVCPGSGEYICSKPLFNTIKIRGKKIVRFEGARVPYIDIVMGMR